MGRQAVPLCTQSADAGEVEIFTSSNKQVVKDVQYNILLSERQDKYYIKLAVMASVVVVSWGNGCGR